MLYRLPISQLGGEQGDTGDEDTKPSPCGSMTQALITEVDVPCSSRGPPGGEPSAAVACSTQDLFCSFPATPVVSPRPPQDTSLPKPSVPPQTFGAPVATPLWRQRRRVGVHPTQRQSPRLVPGALQQSPRLASGLSSSSSGPAGPPPQSKAEALGSVQPPQPNEGALGPSAKKRGRPPVELSAGFVDGKQTFYPQQHVLRRATRKRKPEDSELEEQQRRKRVCFNVQQAMQADAPAVQACLTGFKMPAWLYEALRLAYCDHYAKEYPEKAASMSAVDFRKAARADFTWCGKTLRRKLLTKMLDDQDTLSEKWTDIKMTIARIDIGKGSSMAYKDTRVFAQVPMFTYNSQDWFLEELELEENKEAWAPESLVARAKELPKVKAVWERFTMFQDEKAQQLGAEWVASLELSLDTYEETGKVRFHLAVVLSRAQQMRFTPPSDFLEFEGSHAVYKPKLNQEALGKMSKKIGFVGLFAQAAYYLQMPKKGMVLNDGTKQPYVDYKVNARWVTEYVQARICPNSLKNNQEPLALQSLLFFF